MTRTVVINVVLDLAVLVAIVGGMTWAILSDRPRRKLIPARARSLREHRHSTGRHPAADRASTVPEISPRPVQAVRSQHREPLRDFQHSI